MPDRFVDQFGASATAVPEAYAFPVNISMSSINQLSPKDIQTAQEMDLIIGPIKRHWETKRKSHILKMIHQRLTCFFVK